MRPSQAVGGESPVPASPTDLPVPPGVTLPPSAGEQAVRDAVAALDGDRRLGCAHQPLFLAAECGGARIGYLGLTTTARQWLERTAGPAFAASCDAALRESLLTGDQRGSLPADGTGQVVLAARVLLARSPGKPLRIRVTPLGYGASSGTGLAHSRDPATGQPGACGVFAPGMSGSGLLTVPAAPITSLRPAPHWLAELRAVLDAAENLAGYPVSAEFVVENGKLWILSVRSTELRGAALVLAAAAGAVSGRAGAARALLSVPPAEFARALAPGGTVSGRKPAARGVGVSPGVAAGTVVLSPADAVLARASGERPVLVLDESRPADLDGLMAAVAVVTAVGGYTSHAALVTRGIGVPCVTGLRDAKVDRGAALVLSDGTAIGAGGQITVDGGSGLVYTGGADPAGAAEDSLPGEVARAASALLALADQFGGMAVRVNADSAADARRGIGAGAAGVGLCRVEHMLLGERRELIERLLTEPPGPGRTMALDDLRDLLRADLTALLIAADGLPVAVRLLDPPAHEFNAGPPGAALAERNPLLGVRGVRLNLLMMDLAAAQIDALAAAAAAARRAGARPMPELLVPMVAAAGELDAVRGLLDEASGRLPWLAGPFDVPVGAMIETPRAALLAGELAARSDFLCLGTNDLTALTWGLSRDDAESELLPRYSDLAIVPASPFVELDIDGVGALLRQAVSLARSARPGLPVGVCGEHAASEGAVSFCAGIGVDYVSCSPPLVPVARLACARAAIVGAAGAPVSAGEER